jgi:HPt (histidine-containing phosphotransfer) domain-containing protein
MAFDRAQFDALAGAIGQRLFASHLASFAASTPASLEKMSASLDRRDLDAVAREAHRLRGFTSNFGAVGLGRVLLELEAACEARDLGLADRLLAEVRNAAAEAQGAITRRMAELDAAGGWPFEEAPGLIRLG